MWRRIFAFLIDLWPIVVLAVVENAAGIAAWEVIGIVNLTLLLCYYAGMNYRYGATVGKRMMGLRVAIPNSPDVALKLIWRAIVKIFCLVPPQLTISGLMAIWRKDGRSLADLAVDSNVVEADALSPLESLSIPERILASALVILTPLLLLLVLIAFLFATLGEWKVQ